MDDHATLVQRELALLQATAKEAARADTAAAASACMPPSEAFDALAPVEQAAASLGVHPEAYRPIGWMNNAHHTQLLEANALDSDLARRIEAYRHVASS